MTNGNPTAERDDWADDLTARGEQREPTSRRQLRMRCAYAVQAAIKRGELAKLDGSTPCVDCGRPATMWEHRSYFRPLDVEAVCRRCNMKRGPAEPKWLPDYTGAVGQSVEDERQAQLIRLIDEGATMEEMGASLGVTRERARQLIWTRGLRPRWAAKQQEQRNARLSERAAIRTAKYLSGVAGCRQRVVTEAARRGLRVEVPGQHPGRRGPGGFRVLIEGVPVSVHRIGPKGKPWWPNPAQAASGHPGYYHVHAAPRALNVYALPDGRLAFVLAPASTGRSRTVTMYLRIDRLVTDWPTVEEWADFRILLVGTGPALSVVASGSAA